MEIVLIQYSQYYCRFLNKQSIWKCDTCAARNINCFFTIATRSVFFNKIDLFWRRKIENSKTWIHFSIFPHLNFQVMTADDFSRILEVIRKFSDKEYRVINLLFLRIFFHRIFSVRICLRIEDSETISLIHTHSLTHKYTHSDTHTRFDMNIHTLTQYPYNTHRVNLFRTTPLHTGADMQVLGCTSGIWWRKKLEHKY
jgi:hypothetical protein